MLAFRPRDAPDHELRGYGINGSIQVYTGDFAPCGPDYEKDKECKRAIPDFSH
jgi:hypothetical protein